MARVGFRGEEDFGYVFVGDPGEYDPVFDDHEPASVDEDDNTVLFIREVHNDLSDAAKRLGLGAPVIYFVDLSEYSELARYINGTNQNPNMLFDPFANPDYGEVWLSLLHELAHAYVESWGLDGQEPDEEEVVEDFAQSYDADPSFAVAELSGWAESRAE